MQQAQSSPPPRSAPAPAAASTPVDEEAVEEAAAAVTSSRRKDPYLDAIRKVRDIYLSLPVGMRRRVHDFVGDVYLDPPAEQSEEPTQ